MLLDRLKDEEGVDEIERDCSNSFDFLQLDDGFEEDDDNLEQLGEIFECNIPFLKRLKDIVLDIDRLSEEKDVDDFLYGIIDIQKKEEENRLKEGAVDLLQIEAGLECDNVIERIKEDSDSCEEDALASYDLIDMQKEEEDVDDSANEERQYAECLEIDLLKNKADEMEEDIVVDFLQNDDGFEFDDVDVDADV